jgi:hypothetical protein
MGGGGASSRWCDRLGVELSAMRYPGRGVPGDAIPWEWSWGESQAMQRPESSTGAGSRRRNTLEVFVGKCRGVNTFMQNLKRSNRIPR